MNGDTISTQPMRQSYPTQHSTRTLPPSRGYLGLIIIGVIIMMIGGIIYVSLGFFDEPDRPQYSDFNYDSDAYDEAMEKYDKDIEGYNDAKRIIPTIGQIFEYIGLMFLAIGLIIGAIKDESLPANGRLGLLFAFGVVIGLKFMSLLFGYVVSPF